MARASSVWRSCLHRLAAASFCLAGLTVAPAGAQTLLTTDARYPRVIALPGGELIATVLSSPNDFNVKVFSSTDKGATFRQIGTIDDPEFKPTHTSSPSLFRLSRTVGSLKEGTLILGLNVDTTKCETCRSRIKIYKSTDNGRRWRFVSVAVRAANAEGLWEPDFSIAADGALVMHYADETSGCCSQKLVRRRTYDGVKWIDHTNTVALSTATTKPEWKLRPGMPVVSKLGDGRWLMTYEVCGQPETINCESRYRVSTDGWDYGPINAIGTKMQDATGRYFLGTPVNMVLPDGALLWTGHFLRERDGAFAPLNGRVIFKSASGSPDGPWTAIPAPIPLSDPRKPNCEGYSPGLQGIGSGEDFVQMTSRRNARGACDMFYATGVAKRTP